MYLIGLDDTDNLESRGTGHLAREIAGVLAGDYAVLGVTRHQLLLDPRVPSTKNNSCAAIALEANGELDPQVLAERVQSLMLADFQPGSDPGLCVARRVPGAVVEFGRKAQRALVSQVEARSLASAYGITLLGLGGDEDGVIGALAAVGLASTGHDGRYIHVGHARDLTGMQTVDALLAAGVAAVQTAEGAPVTEGLVLTDKLRPACRNGRPIAVVEWQGDHWLPLKLD
ncbi:MAG: ABC transporter substrate-binding protein [Anaerolineae bacterium]